MTSNCRLISVYFNSSAQRLMVKTTQKSDLPWSAIFSVISILVTLTSRCDSHFELLSISFNDSKLDGVDINSDRLDFAVRKNRAAGGRGGG